VPGPRRVDSLRLGEIFGLPWADASWILEVTAAAHRKRLERVRQRIRPFIDSTCGIVNPNAFCRCARRAGKAIKLGRVDPRRSALATQSVSSGGRDVAQAAAQLDYLQTVPRCSCASRLRRGAGQDLRDTRAAALGTVSDARVGALSTAEAWKDGLHAEGISKGDR
jgi:hypothetical protein